MYPDKAMRVTPRPMSNNKMETSPLIEECTIAEETSPAAGERMVACVEARGTSVTRANREGVGSVRAIASCQSVFLMSRVDPRQTVSAASAAASSPPPPPAPPPLIFVSQRRYIDVT